MKKTILVLFFILFSSSAFALNNILMSSQQKNRWLEMKKANHKYYQDLKFKADNHSNYGEIGQWDAMLCELEGNTPRAYCDRAWTHVEALNYEGTTSYNLSGLHPNNDRIRENFLHLTMMYSSMCQEGRLNSDDCSDFREILENMKNLTLNDPPVSVSPAGIRPNDTDRTISSYFGSTVYSIVIRDEDPIQADLILNHCGTMNESQMSQIWCHGGLVYDGEDNKVRTLVQHYFDDTNHDLTRCDLVGGVYCESATYNLSTLRLALRSVGIINEYYGVDYFPELTSQYQNIAEALISSSVWDFSEFWLWGEVEDAWFGNYKPQSSLDAIGEIYHVTSDPNIAMLYHGLYESRHPASILGFGYMNLWSEAVKTKPTGNTSHFAEGRGIAFWHEGWKEGDTYFVSELSTPQRIDHTLENATNFGIWKNGNWLTKNPNGYFSIFGGPYFNSLLVWGGFGTSFEAQGSYAYKDSANYVYHVGGHGGSPQIQKQYNGAREVVSEATTPHFLHENSDGSTTFIKFDRLKTCGNYSKEECDKFGHKRVNFMIKNRMKAADYKHQLIWHMNEDATVNDSGFNYTSLTGDEIYVYPFISGGYTIQKYNTCDEFKNRRNKPPIFLNGVGNPSAFCNQDFVYHARVIPNDINPFQTFQQILHAGQTQPNLTEIVEFSGENVKGVKVSGVGEEWAIIFSAQENETPKPTNTQGGAWRYSSTRFEENSVLRFLHEGYSVHLNLTGRLYMVDLDPKKSWKYRINDGQEQILNVDSNGFAEISTTGSIHLSVF